MTDARFPERWLNDRRLLRLTADQFRTFTWSLVWTVSNRTDGALDTYDLTLVPGATPADADALVQAGLWQTTSHGWQITDWSSTQTGRDELEVLENARRRDREKKARQRANPRESPGTVPGDVPRDESPGQHRQGKDRTGRTGQAPKPATNWPPVTTPGGAP